MTRTKLNFVAALLAASLIVPLSVYGLADGQEGDDNQQADRTALDDIDVEEIDRRVERALEAVPWPEISRQLADVRGILDGVDPEGIRAEVEAAMDELDVEQIRADVREALEGVDWDEIRQDIEDARAEIEKMDVEGIRAEVFEAVEDVDWDEIRRSLEDAKGVAAEELRVLDEVLEELGIAGSGVI